MKKIFFLFIVLVSLGFSASSVATYSFDGQTNSRALGIYFDTSVRISNNFEIASSPEITDSGKYCEGEFTFERDFDVDWALGSDFEAVALYFGGSIEACYPLDPEDHDNHPNECPPYPIDASSISSNRPIKLISDSDYSNFQPIIAEEIIYSYRDFNFLQTLYSQPVDYLYSYDDFYGKLGSVNLFCKAHNDVYVNGELQTSTQIVGSLSNYSETLDQGNYEVYSKLSDMECFGAVKAEPSDSNFFKMTLYVDDSLNFGSHKSGPSQFEVVSEPEFSFTFFNVQQQNGNSLCFNSSNPVKTFVVYVQNTGDVDAKITGYEILNSDFALIGTLADASENPWSFIDENNYVLEAGEVGQIGFFVRYTGEGASEDEEFSININFEATHSVCTPDIKTETVNIEIPLFCEETYEPRCEIEPSFSDTVEVGVPEELNVHCYNEYNQEITCGPREWNYQSQETWDFEYSGDEVSGQPDAVFTATEESRAVVTAYTIANGNTLTCNADLTTTGYGDDLQYRCEVERVNGSGTLEINQEALFQIVCYNFTRVVPCDDTTWNVEPDEWELEYPASIPGIIYNYDVKFTPTTIANGVLNASSGYHGIDFECGLRVRSDDSYTGEKSCVVNVVEHMGELGEFKYGITCYEDYDIVDCIGWSGYNPNWQLEIDPNLDDSLYEFDEQGYVAYLDIPNYLDIIHSERDVYVMATLQNAIEGDLVCDDLETVLPNIFCQIFI